MQNLSPRHFARVELARRADHADENAIFARLPETFSLIEAMIEHCSRFEAYVHEVRTIGELGIGFDQWQHIAPPQRPDGPSPRLMCIRITPRVH